MCQINWEEGGAAKYIATSFFHGNASSTWKVGLLSGGLCGGQTNYWSNSEELSVIVLT